MDSTRRNIDGSVDPGTIDEVFQLLGNQMRRELLVYLEGRDGKASLDELVEYLSTAIDNHHPPVGAPPRDDVEIKLQHMHLPKLVDAGIVEYERQDHVVEYREDPLIERVMDVVIEAEQISQ